MCLSASLYGPSWLLSPFAIPSVIRFLCTNVCASNDFRTTHLAVTLCMQFHTYTSIDQDCMLLCVLVALLRRETGWCIKSSTTSKRSATWCLGRWERINTTGNSTPVCTTHVMDSDSWILRISLPICATNYFVCDISRGLTCLSCVSSITTQHLSLLCVLRFIFAECSVHAHVCTDIPHYNDAKIV